MPASRLRRAARRALVRFGSRASRLRLQRHVKTGFCVVTNLSIAILQSYWHKQPVRMRRQSGTYWQPRGITFGSRRTQDFMASVIIADDHPLMLAGIETVLTAAGHQIAAKAHSGEAALAIEGGDLFLVDLKMSGGSGLDVLRALRERGDPRPLILLTAAIDTPSLREALSLGINGVVMKASPLAQLLLCIDQVLAAQRWLDPSLIDQVMAAKATTPENMLTNLSARDQSIVRLVVSGLRNRDIGERLSMTEGNVKVTLHRIYERLGVANRVELAMMARDAMDAMTISG